MKNVNGVTLIQIISSLLIVNYHTGNLAIPTLSNIAKFGFIFNTVFVFLSGYLLSQSLSATHTPKFRDFIYKRINRIYPSFHVALVIISLIYFLTGKEFTIKSLLLASTGFSYYFGDNTFGPHLWFVSVIMVCYLICIPTYHFLTRNPILFFILIFIITTTIVVTNEGSFYGIYNKVSSNIAYRFIYHYIVFSIAIYTGITKILDIFKQNILWISFFLMVFPLYLWTKPNLRFGIIAIITSIMLSICIIKIIMTIYPFIKKYLYYIFFLSTITYQLYLVHYSVITAIDGIYHGKLIGYPLVFLFSIALSFLILILAKPYEIFTKRCTGWLLRYTP